MSVAGVSNAAMAAMQPKEKAVTAQSMKEAWRGKSRGSNVRKPKAGGEESMRNRRNAC